MKTTLTILISFILTNLLHSTTCTISGTVTAGINTCSSLVSGDTMRITGTLSINGDYSAQSGKNITIIVDGGSISWTSNAFFQLGSSSYLYLYNGGALVNASGSCNSQRKVMFGTTDVVSCNGGGGSGTYSFAEYNTAGGGGSGGPLPVELVSFDAKRIYNQGIQISWTTANELNNARFEVERSYDGIQFDSINTVVGTNTNQTQTYSVIDNKSTSTVTYYRLKQVDNNLEFSYSKTVQLASLNSTLKPVVSLQPNPNKGVFNLQWNATETGELNITIYDYSGSLVLAKKVQSFEGDNTLELNLESLALGTYMVTTQTNGQTSQTKFQRLKE